MKTITNKPTDNMVQTMRQIRDEINYEIKDMTFAEERAFLDKILQANDQTPAKEIPKKGRINIS
jgi:hypothetical protein